MFRQVDLPDGVPGRLYLHSMPGRNEGWSTFVAEAESARLDLLVCLTPTSEIQLKSPAYAHARLASVLPCECRDFPIPDFGAPPVVDRPAFRGFVAALARELAAGTTVLIHCGAGIGRTGTLTICLLLELGVEPQEADRRVRHAGSRPEVEEQKELTRWYSTPSYPS